MGYVTGIEAVRLAFRGRRTRETGEGVIVYPDLRREAGTFSKDGVPGVRETRTPYRARIPEFWPATPGEAYRMACSAGNYAETYGTPILVRLAGEVRYAEEEIRVRRPAAEARRQREYAAARKAFPGAVPSAAFSDSAWNRAEGAGSRGIIVRGPAFLTVEEAAGGIPCARILKIGTVNPFPEEKTYRFLSRVRSCLVIDDTKEELLLPVYAVKGKYDLPLRVETFHGAEHVKQDVLDAVARFLAPR